MRAILGALVTTFCLSMPAHASDGLDTRWMRDSAEYWTLARQTYRTAEQAVRNEHKNHKKWAVVLDLDETVVDNSTYQIERKAYGETFELKSWNAQKRQRRADATARRSLAQGVVRKIATDAPKIGSPAAVGVTLQTNELRDTVDGSWERTALTPAGSYAGVHW